MNNNEHSLEFNKIKEIMIDFASTDRAKDEIIKLKPYLSEIELIAKLRDTSEAKAMIEAFGNPPLTSLTDIKQFIMIAEKGGCLTGEQLEAVEISLTAVKRLIDYLNRCKQLDLSLPYYAENLNSLDEVREAISLKIRNGKVDDFASKLLKTLRSSIDSTESKMREKAESIIRNNKAFMSDSFITIKNSRVCIPVKKEYKLKISGQVVDKSSTGSTLFIEPSAVSKYYEELQSLKIDAENEEIRILYSLTAMLSDVSAIINQNNATIENLDFIFSKGKLSLYYDGAAPKINTLRQITLKDARHPLMNREIAVPLQFEIGNGISGIIITGPNTGGKTVAIKTVALNCMMAQCGLHVSCREADICMNSSFLCDIGDGQNISENLSTFSAHITNVLDILKHINKDCLVIMDELGSGTDPTEGMGIAVSILNELKKSDALFLVTTHYPEVKLYAEKEEGIINARMTFDKESLKPLYQLVIGEAGESCAFFIAEKLGMPKSMLKQAIKAAYGDDKLSEFKFDSDELNKNADFKRTSYSKIKKTKKVHSQTTAATYCLGDSVLVYPDKKIGIVCETANEKGVLRVLLNGKKIFINHKRIKLYVKAEELYPADYDFSIVFESVKNRKLKHDMDRKYIDEMIEVDD